ncbi:MAG: phosphoglucosamine mutase [Methanospirillaceae archaeon]|nr:phosphoglucosamine mutase [Methanospirillaceae archaeon]
MSVKQEKQLFGTNGIRGIIGRDMTPELAHRMGLAVGTMRPGIIAVGRDTRTSGPSLVAAVTSGLLATGCTVVDCGIVPIPALQFSIRDLYDAGIMITASHNPPEYNGIKVIDGDGTEMGDEEAIRLEYMIFHLDYNPVSWQMMGTIRQDTGVADRYVKAIVESFPQAIGSGIKVAIDAGSGAAYQTTARILKELGSEVLTLNTRPDGTFPARNPEPDKGNLMPLAELVTQVQASFGVAHDGDADRAVFVDDKGEYVEENQEFALIEDVICGRNEKPGIIVTPVSTSRLADHVASRHHCSVYYTPVGSIYVARTMRSLLQEGKTVIFGGEGNGGLIYPQHQFCRDGGMTAAMMLFLVSSRKKPVSELLLDLPSSSMIKKKVHTPETKRLLSFILDQYRHEKNITIDGIRIERDDSWALIRPSGTEPFVRVYVEAFHNKTALSFWEEIQSVIIKVIPDCVIT